MAKYLIEATYTADGAKGLLAEGGSKRKEAVEAAIKNMGAVVECFYYAFGERDLVVIVDAPDAISVAALNLQVAAAGGARTKTTALLTPQEIDQATKKAVSYRRPGG